MVTTSFAPDPWYYNFDGINGDDHAWSYSPTIYKGHLEVWWEIHTCDEAHWRWSTLEYQVGTCYVTDAHRTELDNAAGQKSDKITYLRSLMRTLRWIVRFGQPKINSQVGLNLFCMALPCSGHLGRIYMFCFPRGAPYYRNGTCSCLIREQQDGQ